MLPSDMLLPRRTLSGKGRVLHILDEAAAFGNSGVLIHGRSLRDSGTLAKILESAPNGLSVVTHMHAGNEPTVGEVDALRQLLDTTRCQWIAAIGGGSVMDLAKAGAALMSGEHKTETYLAGQHAVPGSRLPLLMAPTTAGTGSEATIVAVLSDPGRNLKASIRHASLMPHVVILDHGLLASCPRAVIAASGLDAFVQAVESYTSRYSTAFTRLLSEAAVQCIAGSLSEVFHGHDEHAAALMEGSYLAGIALSHARLGLVHGLAHPLGHRWHAAHGLVCALCLAPVLRFNRDVSAVRMQRLAQLVGKDIETLVREWMADFNLPNVFAGETISDRDAIIRETLASGSTKANPRDVTEQDVNHLLDEIFAARNR